MVKRCPIGKNRIKGKCIKVREEPPRFKTIGGKRYSWQSTYSAEVGARMEVARRGLNARKVKVGKKWMVYTR